MKRALVGTYSYAEFGACLAAWMPILAGSRIVHRNDPVPRIPGRWLRRLARVSTSLSPLWKFEVRGAAPADIGTHAYVVVCNHESSADPFLLSHLPWDMRWVAKQELFRTPMSGWALSLSGDIPLRRGNPESVRAMLAECRRTLSEGLSVMMFPEGTRSEDGTIGRFKDGAFELAIDAGVPVLPLALIGTRDCRPKGSVWFGEASAVVRVLEPMPTRGMTREDLPRLKDEARERIVAAVSELRTERNGG